MQERLRFATGIILLILYGLVLNLPYYHLREFQGEEGRRVVIAQEMLITGDWIVPREGGEIYLKKPPMFNWLLALMFKCTGRVDEVTARSVSVIFAILCAILLSVFWMNIINSWTRGPQKNREIFRGALWIPQNLWGNSIGLGFILPGLVFLSFPDVIDKAIRAEIDITFTFFVTFSIISWFYLHEIKKKPFLAWMVSVSGLSLSLLTKGLISIFFFYITVASYLFYRRRFYEFINLKHLGGFLIGIIPFSLWFIPLIQRIEVSQVFSAWINEIIVRKEPLKEGGFLRHLLEFPYLYTIAYLPWIVLLILSPGIHNLFKKEQDPKDYGQLISFCLLPVIISFILFWLIPGARVRYLLPLSGLLALAISVAIVRAVETPRGGENKGWTWFYPVVGVVLILSGAVILFLKERFGVTGPVSYAGGIILFGGGICLISLKDFRKRLFVLLVLVLVGRNTWASIYFPYHQKNLSYYREAAIKINMLVPPDSELYDYNLGNPNLIFYLKRKVRKLQNQEELKEGDYILVRKGVQVIPCEWEEITSFRARKMDIGTYRKDGRCS